MKIARFVSQIEELATALDTDLVDSQAAIVDGIAAAEWSTSVDQFKTDAYRDARDRATVEAILESCIASLVQINEARSKVSS